MTQHSISEAARLTGKARSTIHNHIKKGSVSKTLGEDGQPYIETAELERVYGSLQTETLSDDSPTLQNNTPKKYNDDRALQVEIEGLRERLADRDEALAARDDVIRDLRERLDSEAEERRRLTRLLTDQRSERNEGRRSIWQRLMGK